MTQGDATVCLAVFGCREVADEGKAAADSSGLLNEPEKLLERLGFARPRQQQLVCMKKHLNDHNNIRKFKNEKHQTPPTCALACTYSKNKTKQNVYALRRINHAVRHGQREASDRPKAFQPFEPLTLALSGRFHCYT